MVGSRYQIERIEYQISDFKKGIELELSITTTKGVFWISSVLLVIVGFMSNRKILNKAKKRKKAKNKFRLDLFLALYK
jgi:hypothetical protein